MTALPSQLPVPPITRKLDATVELPGSKSITNRALLLSALCDKPVTLQNALFSDDTRLMSAALRQLGFTVTENETAKTITLSRQAAANTPTSSDSCPSPFTRPPSHHPVALQVGLAGTAARFLTALCAAAPHGTYNIDGTEKMRTRPMRGLIEALRQLGADIHCAQTEGHLPVTIRARGLEGGPVAIDATESSQMLSALLMVAPLARTPISITTTAPVRAPFVEMTLRMMRQFGHKNPRQFLTIPDKPPPTSPAATTPPSDVGALLDDARDNLPSSENCNPFSYISTPYTLPATAYAIEPDATAASYFLALALIHPGTILRLPGLASATLQGDTAFIQILRKLGLKPETQNGTLIVQNTPAVPSPKTETRELKTENFSEFSDTFLTLAAIAPLLPNPTRITGIAHTRLQETDRVANAARELRKLNQHVIETRDTLEIHPRPLPDAVAIDTHGDHRFAMSFAILGTHDLRKNGRPWLTINNPAVTAKTFPNFFTLLAALR